MTYGQQGAFYIAIGAIIGLVISEIAGRLTYHKIRRAASKQKDKELKERVKKLREEFAEK